MKKTLSKHRASTSGKASPLLSQEKPIRRGNEMGFALQDWELGFRAAAKADAYKLLRRHLQDLGRPDKPKLFLEDTIQVVRACIAYASQGDKGPSAARRILNMQEYNPAEAADSKYALTFDLCGKRYARVIALPGIWPLDLADLYGHPWSHLKLCGYSRFWISRIDGRSISQKEIMRLQQAVAEDLRFDYPDETLEIFFSEYDPDAQRWFNDNYDYYDEETLTAWRDDLSPNRGTLLVRLNDLDLDEFPANFGRMMWACRWLEDKTGLRRKGEEHEEDGPSTRHKLIKRRKKVR